MANRYAGHGGEYKPTESLEDAAFQALMNTIVNPPDLPPRASVSSPHTTPQAILSPHAPAQCAISDEKARQEADNLAYVGFDIITLIMLMLAMIIVIKTIKCIFSLRVVRAKKTHQH
jgi:hypothetical protein